MCKCEQYQKQIKKLKEQLDEAIEYGFILLQHNNNSIAAS